MRRLSIFVLLLLVSGVVSACAQTESPPPPTATAAPTLEPTITPTPAPTLPPSATPLPRPRTTADNPAEQAHLRAANAVPGLGGIEFIVNGVAVASQLNYGQATEPSGIVAGEYVLLVRVMAQRGAETAPPLVEQPLVINGGELVTLVLAGTAGEPVLLTYAEADEPLDAGESRLSLIHAVSAAPSLGLVRDDTPLSETVAFGERSPAATVASGPASVDVGDMGLALATYDAELRERRDYTLIFAGHGDDLDTLTLIPLVRQMPGRATIRAANTVEATSFDVYGNGRLLAAGLDHTRITERLPVASGAYTIEVLTADREYGAAAPLVSTQFNLSAGQNLTLIVSGTTERLDIMRVQEDLSPTAPETAHIVFAHAVRQGQPVRLDIEGDALANPPIITYRQASDVIALQATERNLNLASPDAGAPVEYALDVRLEPGFYYLFLVTGRAPDAPPLIFGEPVGVDERLALSNEALALTETPTPLGGLRIINALNTGGSELSLILNDSPLGPLPGPMRAGPAIMLSEGEHTLSLRRSGDEINLREFRLDISGGAQHTLFLYGDVGGEILDLFTQHLPTFTGGNLATVRLLNITRGVEIDLTLAHADATVDVFIPTPDPTQAVQEDPYRLPMFARAFRVAERTASNSLSAIYPIEIGPRDLYIMDDSVGMIGAALFDVEISPDRHYDVIAYQEAGSRRVRVHLIPHE